MPLWLNWRRKAARLQNQEKGKLLSALLSFSNVEQQSCCNVNRLSCGRAVMEPFVGFRWRKDGILENSH
jgi:hypothetical protein